MPTSLSIVPAAWDALLTYANLRFPASGDGYNAPQQLTYFLLVFGLTPLQILTGLASCRRWPRASLAVLLGACGIAFVVALNIVATRSSLLWPSAIKRILELGIDPLKRLRFPYWTSKQDHRPVSPYARVNGRPPKNQVDARFAALGFEDWLLRIDGLVEVPLCLSLAELRAMPRGTQSTLNVCIQTLDEKWERPGHGDDYEVIDLGTVRAPQVILAYEMNQRLPV